MKKLLLIIMSLALFASCRPTKEEKIKELGLQILRLNEFIKDAELKKEEINNFVQKGRESVFYWDKIEQQSLLMNIVNNNINDKGYSKKSSELSDMLF